MSDTRPTKRVGLRKKITLAALTTFAALAALFFLGELGARSFSFGPRRAVESFFTPQRAFLRDPELGFRLNPEGPGVSSLGIRHPEVAEVKPPGVFRVLVLGDSVAFDVPGFVTMIREELHRTHGGAVELINASVPGFTTYQQLVFLKRDLIGLDPDLVVLQHCLNDNYQFLHFVDDSGRWLLTPEVAGAAAFEGLGPLAPLARSSHLLTTVRIWLAHWDEFSTPFVWKRRPDFRAAWEDSSWPRSEAYLTEMSSLLSAVDAELMIVSVPFEPQLSTEALEADRAYTLKPQRRLREITARIGVPMLDLFPSLSQYRDEELYRDGIHFTERGHRIVADEWMTFVREHELVPPR